MEKKYGIENSDTLNQWEFLNQYFTLFRRSSIKLIIFLGRHYTMKYHVRDLSRLLHYDVSMISKNLKYLENMNLVIHEDIGNLVFYQANMNNMLLKQVKICFTLIELDSFIQEINSETSNIVLFGSCATGEDENASDIDLFIETINKDAVKLILDSFRKKLTRTISPIICTPNETYILKTKDSSLFTAIHQGINLKGRMDVL